MFLRRCGWRKEFLARPRSLLRLLLKDQLKLQPWPCFVAKDSGGGGQGGLNLPLPVPYNPGSRSVFFGSRPFAFFSIAKYCAMLHNFSLLLPLPATLGIPLPAPSSPPSRTPPAPFFRGLPPPLSLPTGQGTKKA